MIKDRDKRVSIEHRAPQKSRTLVGVEVTPSHDPEAILPFYQIKIS